MTMIQMSAEAQYKQRSTPGNETVSHHFIVHFVHSFVRFIVVECFVPIHEVASNIRSRDVVNPFVTSPFRFLFSVMSKTWPFRCTKKRNGTERHQRRQFITPFRSANMAKRNETAETPLIKKGVKGLPWHIRVDFCYLSSTKCVDTFLGRRCPPQPTLGRRSEHPDSAVLLGSLQKFRYITGAPCDVPVISPVLKRSRAGLSLQR